jgi:hypothetical protein
MRLLWITHRRSEEMSYASRRGIAGALEARGWSIEWMSPDGQHRVERSTRLGRGHRSFTRSVSTTLAKMDLKGFSAAIVEWTAVAGATESLSAAGLPWVIMDRSPPVSTGVVGWLQSIQYRKAWSMASQLAAGRAVKSPHMATSQEWSGPSAVVPAGVSIEHFRPASMNEDPIIVCHGSLDRERELHRLVEMGFQPYLFGAGNDAQRLSELTRVEGAGPVAQRLAACDIGVMHLPARDVWKHASPLKVAEFAAAGLPVVASEVSGLVRYRDSDWLKLIPLGDDGACQEALLELCALSLEQRKRLGDSARKEARDSMAWTHCTEDLHAMLIEVKR